jgi:LPXTG-motif cell wall-anchored protein
MQKLNLNVKSPVSEVIPPVLQNFSKSNFGVGSNNKNLMIGGAVLLLALLVFFYIRKKKSVSFGKLH